ncbi:DUF4012 domain-containing protein [Actinoplanes sp. N902-109]|uniref:DUF4012 domain-containing protein n=1 Tax=Actinoplanes sp. (strain N902-109) TaxID=649831 RepID=UPI0003295777|nr:DUF4012 domain-containing protein [Actinoplanes sp. N902-109]AGL16328.1 hypothetical protein L083_2818 [Actinoplanes sp. N902-109]
MRRRRIARALLAAGVVVLLAGGATAWIAVRGLSARDHLQRAAALVTQLRTQLETLDPAAATTLTALRDATAAARSDTGDPLWGLGTHTPGAGDDLTAVRTVARALDDFARDGLPALVRAAGSADLSALTPRAGRIDLAPLARSAPDLAAADAALSRARTRIDAIAPAGLTAPVRSAVEELRAKLHDAAALTGVAARSAALLPGMLGHDGPRTYLLLFQNLAEVRASGGMPGAYVVVRATDGRIEIADQGTAAADLRTFARPVLPLSATDRALYTDKLATFPADINITPDFPTTGALAREMYRRRTGHTVDGVFATDPVALAQLLAVIGPVPVPGGPDLTAANAVPVLLSEIYAREALPQDQDRYFAAAAQAVFRALVDRPLQPEALLGALSTAAGERRLLVWSAHPAENALLADTVLAGTLPASDGTHPTVGLFLNDGSGAKLGYYLTHSADLAVTPHCRTDGRRELRLRVTLGSTAPAAGLPDYVLGLKLAGDPYTVRTNVSIYSPTGGSIDGVRIDGAPAGVSAGTDRRRAVGIVTVDLAPGTRRTLEVTLLTGVPAGGYGSSVTPRLRTTPGITEWHQSVHSAGDCPD